MGSITRQILLHGQLPPPSMPMAQVAGPPCVVPRTLLLQPAIVSSVFCSGGQYTLIMLSCARYMRMFSIFGAYPLAAASSLAAHLI